MFKFLIINLYLKCIKYKLIYIMPDYYKKYVKYKNKYNQLKSELMTFTGGGQNIVEELNEQDNILLEKLNKFVNENCNSDYPLATGMFHESGTIIYGISSKNPMGYDVHGEHAAIGQARIFDKDKSKYLTIVSMTKSDDGKYKVKAPCGICRELLRYHYPNMYAIVPHPITKKLVKVVIKYLLPYPYMSTKLPDEAKLEEHTDFIPQQKRQSKKKSKKNK